MRQVWVKPSWAWSIVAPKSLGTSNDPPPGASRELYLCTSVRPYLTLPPSTIGHRPSAIDHRPQTLVRLDGFSTQQVRETVETNARRRRNAMHTRAAAYVLPTGLVTIPASKGKPSLPSKYARYAYGCTLVHGDRKDALAEQRIFHCQLEEKLRPSRGNRV